MKKLFLAVLTIAAISFAAEKNEKCDVDGLNAGWCYSTGYICNLSTEVMGAVRFNLGKNSSCKDAELLQTKFVTYPHVMENGQPKMENGELVLDKTKAPDPTLRVLLSEYAVDGVIATALPVAINSSFVINSFNERNKVRIIYFQPGQPSVNSVLLLGITKCDGTWCDK